ncbi:MAG TPA: hypothetical protein VFE38_13885 [Edaphobacter sp.]|nr:hypothetical protein [Edaphobacter sp.]
MKRIGFLFGSILMVAISLPTYSQQTKPEGDHTTPAMQQSVQSGRFKLTFIVREMDEKGKLLNSREYEALVGLGPHGDPLTSIRTGARVPVRSSSMQYSYLDLGVNFDVQRFQVLSATRVAMNVQADLSRSDAAAQEGTPPIIRQNKWAGNEEMTLGERKVIFSSDDLTSKNKVQVELTVTEVK